MKFGVIIGNRGFFPDHLAKSGREDMIRVLEAAGFDVVIAGPDDTKYGAVETREEARKCAALFDDHRKEIDGVIVSLPNFGDERAVAETLRMARLNVPVLIQATPDYPRPDDHPRPARQLLRQDVGLQQPDAVRHTLFAYSLHTVARSRTRSGRIWTGSPESAVW